MKHYAQNVITGCMNCGVSVFQYEGRRYTPLADYLLSGNLVGHDRDPEFRRAYIEHHCRPEDLESFSTVAERVVAGLKAMIEDHPPQWLSRDLQDAGRSADTTYAKLQEITALAGLTRECPRCRVAVGSHCENLTERKKGNAVPTKRIHEERIPFPGTVEASELELAREETSKASNLLFEIQEALKTDRALEKLLRIAERCI